MQSRVPLTACYPLMQQEGKKLAPSTMHGPAHLELTSTLQRARFPPRVCALVFFIVVINPRCTCAARVTVLGLFVCLSVCPSVRASSRTTGYEEANEGRRRLLSKENIDINVAIFLKRLRSRDMA